MKRNKISRRSSTHDDSHSGHYVQLLMNTIRFRQMKFNRTRNHIQYIVALLILSFIFGLLYLKSRSPVSFSTDFFKHCSHKSVTTEKRVTFDNASYFLNHYPEFACPQNYRNLADWIFGWPKNVFDEVIEETIYSNRVILPDLPEGSIIYVKTDSLLYFFSNIYPLFQHRFILVTAQGDASAPYEYLSYLNSFNSKILHWFGQNGDIPEASHDRFTHIPIGLNCFEMAEMIRTVHQSIIDHRLPAIKANSPDEPSSYIQPLDVTKRFHELKGRTEPLVLINFDPKTDPLGVRREIWQQLCRNETKSLFHCYTKPPGVQINNLANIYARNRKYPFWLSPRGNGIDCHRTWEALYLDIIPIVWDSTLNSLYRDLPVVIIKHWKDLTEEFLLSQLANITHNKLNSPSIYHMEKIRNAYWHDLILLKSRHSSSKRHIRHNRCWRGRLLVKS